MGLHRRFASRGLIDMLHAMGVCASYQEAVDFETSAVHHARPIIDMTNFEQWVFDNADVNIRTLDGLGTFHVMGGVLCVTPSYSRYTARHGLCSTRRNEGACFDTYS